MASKRLTFGFLLALTAVGVYLCYIMAKPFLKPVILAGVMAIIFYPVHARIRRWFKPPGVAALISTILVLLLIVVPALALARVIAGDVSNLYQALSRRSAEGGGWSAYIATLIDRPAAWASRYVDLSPLNIHAQIRARLEQVSTLMLGWAAGVVGNAGRFLFDAVITFFTLFFLFREGETARQKLVAAIPLERHHVEHLLDMVVDTVIANTHGVLVVSLIQGVLLGLAFWILGLPSAILWGLVTAVCSLIPVVGTALVWVPASVVLLAQHHWWKALILVIWGTAFVGLIDNIVRPLVVRERVKMNTLFIFFALLGGVEAFGFLGIFIGPIVLSLTMGLVRLLREESRQWPGSPSLTEAAVTPEAPETRTRAER